MLTLVLALGLIAGCAEGGGAGSSAGGPTRATEPLTGGAEAVMPQEHMEAILLWGGAGPSAAAERWLVAQGFQTMPMRAGLLVTGGRATFERAFGVRLAGRELPVTLPVPAALQPAVASISIRRPPDYRPGG